MINKLKNCQKTTLIGQLPDIINSNNQSVENEFNWIFDSSLNRLTKSVYAPTGSVKSHFGEFVNLACEYLTVKNVDSLQNSIQRATENVISKTLNTSSMQTVMAALTNIANSGFIDPSAYDISALCDISTLVVNHNVLNNRFYNSDYETTNYTHDAASIVYTKNDDSYTSVYDVLSVLEVLDPSQISSSINNINNSITTINSSISTINNSINNINSSISNINNSITTINNSISIINSSINDLDTNKAYYKNGAMSDTDLWMWDCDHQYGRKAQSCKWNKIGDFMICCYEDIKTWNGPEGTPYEQQWSENFYSLPWNCVEPVHGVIKAGSSNQLLYWSTTFKTVNGQQISVLRLAPVYDAKIGTSEGTALTITYKYQ